MDGLRLRKKRRGRKEKLNPIFMSSTFCQALMRVFQHKSDKNEFFLYYPLMKSS
jgi:hypothetical protein